MVSDRGRFHRDHSDRRGLSRSSLEGKFKLCYFTSLRTVSAMASSSMPYLCII